MATFNVVQVKTFKNYKLEAASQMLYNCRAFCARAFSLPPVFIRDHVRLSIILKEARGKNYKHISIFQRCTTENN